MPEDTTPPPPQQPSSPEPANTAPTPPPPSPQENPPRQDAAQGSGLPPSVAAGLAELFTLVGGIIFYMIDRRQPLVRFHAMQSIYFGAACILLGIVLSIVFAILQFIPILGWFASGLLGFAAAVAMGLMWVIAVFKAFNGIEWEMPFIGRMARQQISKGNV